MISINLGRDTDRLELAPARDAIRLTPAVAGAVVEVVLQGAYIGATAAPLARYRLSAMMRVGTHRDQRPLCELTTEHVVTSSTRAADVVLRGLVTDEQLRHVEELRTGMDLGVVLHLVVEWLGDETKALMSASGYLSFSVQRGEWVEQLERVDHAAVLEVLVPMPADARLTGAVERLGEARRLLRAGQVDSALGAARKALEPVLKDVRDSGVSGSARAKNPRDRVLDERFAVLVEDTFSLLSGAAHDDPVTADFRFSRVEAEALLATTAGLVNRLQ